MPRKRVVVTGMALHTPLGDTLEANLAGLLAGRSAVSRWKGLDTAPIYAKVGGDLSDYDIAAATAALEGRLPEDVFRRLRKLVGRAAWSTRLSLLLAARGFLDAGLFDRPAEATKVATLIAGHNLNANYHDQNRRQFAEEPDFVDALYALHGLDTDHAGVVSELLQSMGPCYTVGGACASGNVALRNAVDEVRHHDVDVALVLGAVLDFAPIDLHAMALMGAISYQSFNDDPGRASRPFDRRREGFVPSHGGGVLVVESLDSAQRRGARIYAELLGAEACADANRLPQPSEDGQTHVMTRLLAQCGLHPEQIDYVNAHATSTQLGDVTEVHSIKRVFGAHARKLRINAPKSMLGHTCWSAPVVETVTAILQMNAGRLHPSVNIDDLDPEVDLDVCRGAAVAHEVNVLMKNSFGFGGINCVSVYKRYEA